MNKKINWWIDVPMLVITIPAFIVSYAWLCMRAGYALAEWYFDPDTFFNRYERKP